MSKKVLTDADKEYISNHYEQKTPSEIRRHLGCASVGCIITYINRHLDKTKRKRERNHRNLMNIPNQKKIFRVHEEEPIKKKERPPTNYSNVQWAIYEVDEHYAQQVAEKANPYNGLNILKTRMSL